MGSDLPSPKEIMRGIGISAVVLIVLAALSGWARQHLADGPFYEIYLQLLSAAEFALSPGVGLIAAIAVGVIYILFRDRTGF